MDFLKYIFIYMITLVHYGIQFCVAGMYYEFMCCWALFGHIFSLGVFFLLRGIGNQTHRNHHGYHMVSILADACPSAVRRLSAQCHKQLKYLSSTYIPNKSTTLRTTTTNHKFSPTYPYQIAFLLLNKFVCCSFTSQQHIRPYRTGTDL